MFMKSRKCTQADKLLWNAFVKGENHALSDIVNKYHSQLVYVLFRYARNESEVEDLISEVFVWLIENQSRLQTLNIRNISAFLIEIGKKIYFSNSRKDKRRKELLAEHVMPFTGTTVHPYGLESAYVEDILNIIKGISNPSRRRILQLLVEGYDAHEISQAFGKTPKWAHQNIYLARKELRSALGNV